MPMIFECKNTGHRIEYNGPKIPDLWCHEHDCAIQRVPVEIPVDGGGEEGIEKGYE